MMSSENEAARMKALTYDEGISVGSTRIDQAVLDYMCEAVGDIPGVEFRKLAEKAIYSHFQTIKHDYGTPDSYQAQYLLPIPGIDVSDRLPPKHFDGICFRISAKDMKTWFDEQIDRIIELGEKQVEKLREEHKKERISFLILSGGFGQNQYVRDRLTEYLRTKTTSDDSAIDPNVEVLSAVNPQLAVVRGLVYNRAQEMMGLTPVYEQVCCRMSYGIVVQEEYSKRKHQGQIPRTSESDGKLWVHGQIDWIIKQGVQVPSTGMRRTYEWTMTDEDDEDQTSAWSCHIVSCDYPRQHLPPNISHRDVKSVCQINVDLDKLPYMTRRRNPLKKDTYRLRMFDLLVIIGAADLRFQVHPRGEGDILASDEHEEIDVLWMKDEEAAKSEVPASEGKQPALSATQPKPKSRTSIPMHFRRFSSS